MPLALMPTLAANSEVMWVAGAAVGVVAILASAIRGVVVSRAREQSRREIAAYIAEGSMTPEQGEKLMAAGDPASEDK